MRTSTTWLSPRAANELLSGKADALPIAIAPIAAAVNKVNVIFFIVFLRVNSDKLKRLPQLDRRLKSLQNFEGSTVNAPTGHFVPSTKQLG
jgi:hypothetical protein